MAKRRKLSSVNSVNIISYYASLNAVGNLGLPPVAIPDIATKISDLHLRLPCVSVYVVTPTQPAPSAERPSPAVASILVASTAYTAFVYPLSGSL